MKGAKLRFTESYRIADEATRAAMEQARDATYEDNLDKIIEVAK